MSLDIELSRNGEEIREMNWLRNPFGLERWAECNVGSKRTTIYQSYNVIKHTNTTPSIYTIDWNNLVEWNLWDVCNKFCYHGSDILNLGEIYIRKSYRELFKAVVDDYWKVIKRLDEGYFFFDLPAYRQLIEGKFPIGVQREEFEYTKDREYLRIPIEVYYEHVGDLNCSTLQDYQDWFKELVEFADDLQDLDNKFYGSN
ncbi:MAG: hypothetical protein ABFC34_07755 [Methanobacterium sp.]